METTALNLNQIVWVTRRLFPHEQQERALPSTLRPINTVVDIRCWRWNNVDIDKYRCRTVFYLLGLFPYVLHTIAFGIPYAALFKHSFDGVSSLPRLVHRTASYVNQFCHEILLLREMTIFVGSLFCYAIFIHVVDATEKDGIWTCWLIAQNVSLLIIKSGLRMLAGQWNATADFCNPIDASAFHNHVRSLNQSCFIDTAIQV